MELQIDAMVVASGSGATHAGLLFGLKPQLGNVGIWIALTGFMATRSLTLILMYPRLARAI